MRANSLEILEKSSLPPDQAKAILRAMECEFDERESRLLQEVATKKDLNALREDFLGLRGEVGGLRTEVGSLRGEVDALRKDMVAGYHALELRMAKFEAKMAVWLFTMFIALVGLLYAFPTKR
jgi:predicted  nucleic acid-binding Zn-ribbon protein